MSAADESEAALLARLEGLGIGYVRYVHAPMFTVEDGQALYAGMPGGHAKNLFLKDRTGALFRAVVEAGTPVSMRALEKRLGAARLSFGPAELMEATLGVTPGSVTAFGLINDAEHHVHLFLDRNLQQCESLSFHPNDCRATAVIARTEFERYLALAGNSYEYLDLY